MRLIAATLPTKVHSGLRAPSPGGGPPSLGRKLFTDAHASSNVPRLVKGRAEVLFRQQPLLPSLIHYLNWTLRII